MSAKPDLYVQLVDEADTKMQVVGDQVLDIAGVADGAFVATQGGVLVPRTLVEGDIPSTIARDAEVTAAVAAEATAREAADALLVPRASRASGKASQEFSSSDATTFVDITGLSWAVAAGETWAFEVVLFYDGSTTGDLLTRWTAITNATCRISSVGPVSSLSGVNYTVNGSVVTALNSSLVYGATGAGTPLMVVQRGLVILGDTGGTMQIRFRQSSVDAGVATRVFPESHFMATRL
jgi:hypothetical protein